MKPPPSPAPPPPRWIRDADSIEIELNLDGGYATTRVALLLSDRLVDYGEALVLNKLWQEAAGIGDTFTGARWRDLVRNYGKPDEAPR